MHACQSISTLLQSAICVQKIRATCRLSKDKEEVQNEPRAKELSALASHVCTGIDNTTECIASWDGQVSGRILSEVGFHALFVAYSRLSCNLVSHPLSRSADVSCSCHSIK